jgi:hypothetical protein
MWKKLLRRFRPFAYAILVLAALLVFSRNWIAKTLVERVGSAFLECRLTIESIHIHWNSIEIHQFVLYDARETHRPLVLFERATIEPTLASGLRNQIWFNGIVVERPHVHLHFDANGQLVSRFPNVEGGESSKGAGRLPLRYAQIRNATLSLHSPDVEQIVFSTGNVAVKIDDQIYASLTIDEIFEGQFAATSTLNSLDFSGASSVRLTNCHIDDHSFRAIQSLLEPVGGFRTNVNVKGRLAHATDFLSLANYEGELDVLLQAVHSDKLDTPDMELQLDASLSQGQLEAGIHANCSSGPAEIKLVADEYQLPFTAELTASVNDWRLDQELQSMTSGVVSAGLFNLSATTDVVASMARLDFNGDSRAVLSGVVIDGNRLNDLHASVQCDGKFIPDAVSPLNGRLAGSLRLDEQDLSQLRLQQTTSDIAGWVSAAAEFQMPVRLDDPISQFTATGAVNWRNVSCDQFSITDDAVRVRIGGMNATADIPAIQLFGASSDGLASHSLGTLAAHVQVTDIVDGRLASHLAVTDVDLSQIEILLCDLGLVDLGSLDLGGLEGVVSADFVAAAPVVGMADPTEWTSQLSVASRHVVALNESIDRLAITARLDRGIFSIEETPIWWRLNRLMFAAKGSIDASFVARGNFVVDELSLSDMADVVSRYSGSPLPLAGIANSQGGFSFDALKNEIRLGGTAELRDVVFAATELGSSAIQWQLSPDKGLEVTTESNDFLGGRYVIALTSQNLDWTRAEIACNVENVDASRLGRLASLPIPILGSMSLQARLSQIGQVEHWTGRANLTTHGLAISNLPISFDLAQIAIGQGIAEVQFSGEGMNGQFAGEAKTRLDELMVFAQRESPELWDLPIVAQFTAKGLEVNALGPALGIGRDLDPLSAYIGLSVVRDERTRADRMLCHATASIEDVQWNHSRLSDRVVVEAIVHERRIQIDRIQGRVADGLLDGRADIVLSPSLGGRFRVGLQRANLRVAAAPLGQQANSISGRGSLQVEGRIGRELSGQVDATISHAGFSGLAVRSVRLPVSWSFVPSTGAAAWNCRSGVVELGGGKISLASSGRFRNTLNANLFADLRNIDTGKLTTRNSSSAGVVNGTVNMVAKHARSTNQLSGDFNFDLTELDSLQLPVLDQLPGLIKLSNVTSLRKTNKGSLRGRLANNVILVEELAVEQQNIQLTLDGRATLDGRLDLDATASTGNTSPSEGLMTLANSPLMMAAPAPAKLLIQANEAMKDRVVHVHIGGTSSNPTLRVQPVKQLSQDALRFFIKTSLGNSAAILADKAQQNPHAR